jgi:NADPH:quinone reductase-like Zn-dependent oxidoreductase
VPLDQLFRVPQGVSLVVAGVIPVASLTAYYALITLGAASEGKKVLIHSAAGGVGSIMVQMAKAVGCEVVAVVGSSLKVEHVRRLGADHVIDKSQQKLFSTAKELCPEGFDLVLDANGVETTRGSYRALRPTGRLVLYGAHSMLSRGRARPNWLKLAWSFLRTPRFFPLDLINENKNVMAFNLSYLFEEKRLLAEAMGRIIDWYESGALQVPALQEYALSEVARAHGALQSGTTVGKLTLVPSPLTK